jgi:hypothetical protein
MLSRRDGDRAQGVLARVDRGFLPTDGCAPARIPDLTEHQ